MISVTASLWAWKDGKGSWHLLTVPQPQAIDIRSACLGPRSGFGSVKVETSIRDVHLRTSICPQKSGGYIPPVKAVVRLRVGISAGDEVTFGLELA